VRAGARRHATLAVVLACLAAGAAPGRAHDGAHLFESVIGGPYPERLAQGVEVRILDEDEQVELVNSSGRTVVVMGFAGEPYARVESGGSVFVNARSPATPANNDRWGRTRPSGREDPGAPPAWVRVGGEGRLVWYERRAQYRRAGTPPQVADPAERTWIRDYRIPLTVGGEPAELRGTLHWVGRRPFPNVALVVLLLATAGCAFFGAITLRRVRRLPDEPAGDDGRARSGGSAVVSRRRPSPSPRTWRRRARPPR